MTNLAISEHTYLVGSSCWNPTSSGTHSKKGKQYGSDSASHCFWEIFCRFAHHPPPCAQDRGSVTAMRGGEAEEEQRKAVHIW